jgi:hypothetical protein
MEAVYLAIISTGVSFNRLRMWLMLIFLCLVAYTLYLSLGSYRQSPDVDKAGSGALIELITSIIGS